MTWTCHVCKQERPDAKISVHTQRVDLGGITAKRNTRYCNDRKSCREGAPTALDIGTPLTES